MLNEIYNQRILELAGNIPRLGRLKTPQATVRTHSKLCGSTVVVDLVMEDGRVTDFAQDVKACALGQAAAAIVGRHVIGATAAELRAVYERVRAMLKEQGTAPEGAWEEAAILEPVRDYKARHASTLLAFEAAARAAAEIDSGASMPLAAAQWPRIPKPFQPNV
jgi:NifU-like protein involved in Fe-S cluster formation